MTNDPSFQQPVNIGAHKQEQIKRQAEAATQDDDAAKATPKKPRKSRKP
ncbi:hypothetical protein [Shinella sp. JR1-6]|nr:hypothetical protein [Shinella sp. JR1-6]